MKKQELLKLATKCFIFNKEVAKLMPNKSMTRRVINIPKNFNIEGVTIVNKKDSEDIFDVMFEDFDTEEALFFKPPYKANHIYWAREPAKVIHHFLDSKNNYKRTMKYKFLSDGKDFNVEIPERFKDVTFVGSNFNVEYSKWISECQGVPNGCIKEMARYFYRITSVRVERLQDISNDDIYKEGVKKYNHIDLKKALRNNTLGKLAKGLKLEYKNLWNSTAKKGINDWDSNPYVWVIEYEEISYE